MDTILTFHKGFVIYLVMLWVLVFYPHSSGFAITYYFSEHQGDDRRSSTEAQHRETPWKSIEKFQEIQAELAPGDSILFECGGNYFGGLELNFSGSAQKPIYLGHYGEGEMPVISGLKKLSGWEKHTEGVFKCPIDLEGKELKVVLKEGKPQRMGRFPNANAGNGGYLFFDEVISENSIKDAKLPRGQDWTGAELVMRKNQWIIDIQQVSAHKEETLTFQKVSGYAPSPRFGYFFQNHIATLDEEGEWYYDSEQGQMFMFFGDKHPDDIEIKVSRIDHLLKTTPVARHLIIDGLAFEGANGDGVHFAGNTQVKFLNNEVRYSGANGIFARDIFSLSIVDCTVDHSYNSGIYLPSGNRRVLISSNLVNHTYLIEGMGRSGDNNGFGIFSVSDEDVISRNRILNSGYTGISFRGNLTRVEENLIDTFCLVKNDGAGIYSYTGGRRTVFQGRVVSNNIVKNGVGSEFGFDLSNKYAPPPVEGIYMDDNVTGVHLLNNQVFDVQSRGIFIHNARNILIKNNLVFNAKYHLYLANDGRGGDLSDLQIMENHLVSKSPDQAHFWIRDNVDNISNLGQINGNHYIHPFGATDFFHVQDTESGDFKRFSLQEWQDVFSHDRSSNSISELYPVDKFITTIRSNLYGNEEFKTSGDGVSSAAGCIVKWGRNGGTGKGFVEVSPQRAPFAFKVEVGEIKSDNAYLLEIGFGPTNDITKLNAFLRKEAAPYSRLSSTASITLSKDNHLLYAIFNKPTDETRAVVLLEGFDKSPIRIESFKFHEINIDVDKMSKVFEVYHNFSSDPKNVNLPNGLITLSGNEASEEVSIPPYSSMIFLRKQP